MALLLAGESQADSEALPVQRKALQGGGWCQGGRGASRRTGKGTPEKAGRTMLACLPCWPWILGSLSGKTQEVKEGRGWKRAPGHCLAPPFFSGVPTTPGPCGPERHPSRPEPVRGVSGSSPRACNPGELWRIPGCRPCAPAHLKAWEPGNPRMTSRVGPSAMDGTSLHERNLDLLAWGRGTGPGARAGPHSAGISLVVPVCRGGKEAEAGLRQGALRTSPP